MKIAFEKPISKSNPKNRQINPLQGSQGESHPKISRIPTKNIKTLCSLNLSKAGLKYFPLELLQLTALKFLILDENFINDLPKEISNLINLEVLSLSNNELRGFEDPIGNLSKLTYLNISKNYITTLNRPIFKLKKLETFLIQENCFTELPLELKELTNLREFGLDWFLYLNPSIEKMTIYKESDSVFQDLFSLLLKKTKPIEFIEFVESLSQDGKSLKNNFKNKYILHKCMSNHNYGIVLSISQLYPSLLNQFDEDGQTALSLALLSKNQILTNLLLKNQGADPSKGGGIYGSNLHIAVTQFDSELVFSLLESGISTNIVDIDKNTPLHLILGSFGKNPQKAGEIATILCERSTDINTLNKFCCSPIHLAVKNNQYEGLKWALNYNIIRKEDQKYNRKKLLFDFNFKTGPYLYTPLHLAVYMGNIQIVQLFGDFPTEINFLEMNKAGKTAKQIASKSQVQIKLCLKEEKSWIKHQILSDLSKFSNINRLPEAIKISENKNLVRNRASSAHISRKKEIGKIEKKILDDQILDTIEDCEEFKEDNSIESLNRHKIDEKIMFSSRIFDKQNAILLSSPKGLDQLALQEIYTNLATNIRSNTTTLNEKISLIWMVKFMHLKISETLKQSLGSGLPYSLFIVNTFLKLKNKTGKNIKEFFPVVLEKILDGIFKDQQNEKTERENQENDCELKNYTLNSMFQIISSEIIYLLSQLGWKNGINWIENKWKNIVGQNLNRYLLFELYQTRLSLISSKKAIVIPPPKPIIIEKNREKIINNNNKKPTLTIDTSLIKKRLEKEIIIDFPKKRMSSAFEKVDDDMIIETTRNKYLKAYYFPSKQDYSPFQTKLKGSFDLSYVSKSP